MKLHVIASSSEGNAYALTGKGETLLIEAGAPFKEVLKAIDYNVKNVVGCIVTHEHGDHAGRVREAAEYCIEVWSSPGTRDAMTPKLKGKTGRACLRAFRGDRERGYETFSLGRFEITPFPAQHDSAEPVGYYIWHPESGGILFATDTYYIRPTFDGLAHVMIECNYDEGLLEENARERRHGVTPELAERIRRSHLGLQTCLGALKANDLSQTGDITLIHVSGGNGRPESFRRSVEAAAGIPTYVARPGLTLDYNTNLF